MKVTTNDFGKIELRNRSVSQIQGRILVAGSSATDKGQQVANILHGTTISLILRRDGSEISILQGKLALLALETSIGTPFFPVIWDFAHQIAGQAYPLRADYNFTEGANIVLPFVIDLKQVINLDGNDELLLDVNCTATQLGTVTTASTNYDFRDAIGVGASVICTRFEGIAAGQPNWVKDLGHNVASIKFICLDNNTVDDTTSPLSVVNLNTDKLQTTDNFYDLLCQRWSDATDSESASKLANNFEFYKGYSAHGEPVLLDKVKVNIDLFANQVNQGKCFVAYRFAVTDEASYLKAQGMRIKHQGRDLMKIAESASVVSNAKSMVEAGEAQQKQYTDASGK